MMRRVWIAAGIAITINLIAGCAGNTRARSPNDLENSLQEQYAGRISLVTQPDAHASEAQSTSFSGSFELRGNAQNGELDLLTPLGQIAAQMRWQPDGASLRSGGQTRSFSSAAAMIKQATGASLSPEMLMAWLRGDAAESAALAAISASAQTTGADKDATLWQVDLSRRSEGRIIAQRLSPAPTATLRIIVDQP